MSTFFQKPSFLKKLSGETASDESISGILTKLTTSNASVPVQIEGSNSWFESRLRLRSGAVLLGYPQPLHNQLGAGTWVRVILPDPPSRVLRMTVASGQYNAAFSKSMGKETLMLICRLHGATVLPNPRRHIRYDTLRYRDLVFSTATPPQSFKVVDLSRSGLRIKADPALLERFPLGEHVKDAAIQLGSKSRVRLKDVRVCSMTEGGIGMEMTAFGGGASEKMLDVFLRWLHGETLKQVSGAF